MSDDRIWDLSLFGIPSELQYKIKRASQWVIQENKSSSLSNMFKRAAPSMETNVTNKLHRAQQKLLEIISDVMQTAKENGSRKTDHLNTAHYLTLEQYKIAVWAANTLKEVDMVLKNNKSKKYLDKNLKTQFDFENAKVKVNKHGKIFVDTAILVQLMDLYNVLGKMMDHLRESASGVPSDPFNTDKEVSLDSAINADRNLKDLLAKLDTNSECTNTKSTKEILTSLSLPLHNKFVVMPAGINNDLSPLTEEQISESREDLVTDAAGARRIIIRCLSNLDKVKHYLYTIDEVEEPVTDEGRVLDADRYEEASDEEAVERDPRREPSLGKTRDPSRTVTREPSLGQARDPSRTLTREPSLDKERERSHSLKRVPSRERSRDYIRDDLAESERKKCCCAEDCPADEPLEFTWKEGDETSSKLVICIKGKTEEDGDVHVVIRQCPECQLIGKVDLQGRNQSGPEPVRSRSFSKETPLAREQSRSRTLSHSQEKTKNYESDILHGKGPDVDCPLSSSEDVPATSSRTDIKVIFDPQDPANSTVEGRRSSQHRRRQSKMEEKMSRIELNETVNLNLQTDQGQDLVISLTVRPKTAVTKQLSIRDIFSDSHTNVPERDRKKSFQEAERGPSERGINKSASRVERSHEDVTIPLSRTKVCSSLEFDVQVVESRMKSSGIRHTNPNVEVRLTDMGVNNLLRACRPVKCGRKAILNENPRKCLPYSPSLESLPLEEVDADIIDQSLDMSIKKSKHSTIFIRDDKLIYNVRVANRRGSGGAPVKQVYFVHVSPPPVEFYCFGKPGRGCWVGSFLGYYIHLESGEASLSDFKKFNSKKESSIDNLLSVCSSDEKPKWRHLEEYRANSANVIGRNLYTSSRHLMEVFSMKDVTSDNKQSWVKRVLGYYINLIDDNIASNRSPVIEVRYFEIENIQKRKDDKVAATILRVRLKKNRNPQEEADRQPDIEKAVKKTAVEQKNKRSKCSSRIPVYKYRYGGCKDGVTSNKTGNRILPLEKKVEGGTTVTQKLNGALVKKQENKNTLQVTQNRSESILTGHSKNAPTNSSNAGTFPNETAEYFNKFMRYISLLNGASPKNQQRKKKEFYTSGSHSLILINPRKVVNCPEKDATANAKLPRNHPETRDIEADATVKKGIMVNDVILSSTRFKKKLNYDKTTSRIVINRLSNFLYDNFIEGVSPKTRMELLNKIDQLLSVYSRYQKKNATLRGRRDAR